ncbi:MAG TPA: hypothetical protein VFZ17_02290 [Acidimicrobiia bacterium]|nr:hypothetical protein [Acidimicrobiia bacterium]
MYAVFTEVNADASHVEKAREVLNSTAAPMAREHGAKGVLKGHAAHHAAKVVWGPKLKADHVRWGDIIPAFDAGGAHFDGLNLDTEGGAHGDTSGQSILDGHCEATEIGSK